MEYIKWINFRVDLISRMTNFSIFRVDLILWMQCKFMVKKYKQGCKVLNGEDHKFYME